MQIWVGPALKQNKTKQKILKMKYSIFTENFMIM